MLDYDIQRELLRCTVVPERALSTAVTLEVGRQNQQRISSNKYKKRKCNSTVQGISRRKNTATTTKPTNNCKSNCQCRNCGTKLHQITVRFAKLLVRSVITVVYSITLQSYARNSKMQNTNKDITKKVF